MDFREYVKALPLLHSWDGGITWNTGGFEERHLGPLIGLLRENLPAHPTILETGAGCSTIAFMFLNPARTISIAPDPGLFERIRAYCSDHGVEASSLDSRIAYSEWELPELARSNGAGSIDFALIDGGHGWPTVFVDFFYANYMLRKGGYLMVDDVQLHSIKELARLLAQQPGFEIALDLGKSLVFQKTTSSNSLPEWNQQPYIFKRSEEIGLQADPFAL